ncbi:MAG: GEVED domain-containing protein [Verrucomicrobiota bacterium]
MRIGCHIAVLFLAGLILPAPALDYGDAPDSFWTLSANNGAYHTNDPLYFMGATIDDDPDGQPVPPGMGDDLDGNNDDDGVIFHNEWIAGFGVSFDVIVSRHGRLSCWIDWNGDGIWSSEKPIVNEVVTQGTNLFFLTVPADAATNVPIYARFRYTGYNPATFCPGGNCNAAGIGARGPASNGEVEDYQISIRSPTNATLNYDFGDLPTPYRTTLADDGARHYFVPGIHLGTGFDHEPDALPDTAATGDDNDGIDDEDGIIFPVPIVPGLRGVIRANASIDGYLSGYIDFNANGSFESSLGEKIIQNRFVFLRDHEFRFNVPSNAVITNLTYARFRFTSYNQGPNGIFSFGPATDGEVEDYAISITGFDHADWGDADDLYQTHITNKGAAHVISPWVYLGERVDAETNGQPSALANADDLNGVDDEDGVTFNTSLIAGNQAIMTIVASTGGYMNAWVDWDNDGDWTFDDQPLNKILASEWLNPGPNEFTIDVPTNAMTNILLTSRFRFCTVLSGDVGGRNSFTFAPDGEVEDYTLVINGGLDFGDAPNNDYQTRLNKNGPSHQVVDGVYLGSGVDTEFDGFQSSMANGDDLNGSDDEDGVSLSIPMEQAAPAEVIVIASTNGFINAWVDFNADGDWTNDANEKIFSAVPVVPGTNRLSFMVPGKVDTNNGMVSRFRFSTIAAELEPFGFAPDGEVEDYLFAPVVPIVDSDDDDLPDWWELEHFGGTTNGIALDDADGDGYSTFEEWVTGTGPLNSNSFFQIHALTNLPVVTLSFTSTVNRLYHIQYNTFPASNAWIDVGLPRPGLGTQISIPIEHADPFRAYRILVDLCL